MSDDRTIGVIVNEGKDLAGGGLEELRAALADLGHADPPWFEVAKSKKAPPKVIELVEKHGVDRLLVWGGDGTVRRCVNTLLHAGHDDVEIGVLPAGTGNLLARNLGIPVDLRPAVEVAVNGEPVPIDVGIVETPDGDSDEHHFLVMAGAGFDALLIEEADGDDDLKDRFGRLGYVWAGIRHRHVSPASATVYVDGDPWYVGKASTVIVANVGTLIGGLTAFPDADPADGRLEVGVVHAENGLEWTRLLAAAILRRAKKSTFTETTTAERVRIEFDRTLPWQVDGGDRDRRAQFEIRCRPSAIRICRPRPVIEL